jgi:hypothetical protein
MNLQMKDDREKYVHVLSYALILIALLSAGLKAEFASFTTDEAWSYNWWISEGLHKIWHDYHNPNNHILHSVLAYFSIEIWGWDEFVLRIPPLMCFALLLLIFKNLAQKTIASPSMRLLALASIALHPYMIDFAALSRGYMLMNACLYGALMLLVWCDADIVSVKPPWKLLGASIALGCAFGAVPIAIYLILAINTVQCARLISSRPQNLREKILVFLAPQALVAGLVYMWDFEEFEISRFFWGTKDLLESFNSFGHILFYIPHKHLDFMGYPDFRAAEFSPWQEDIFSRMVSAGLYHLPLGILIICGMILLFIFVIRVIRAHARPNILSEPTTFFWSIWIISIGIVFIQAHVFDALMLRNRSWIAWFPLFFLLVFKSFDFLMINMPHYWRLRMRTGVLIGALAFNAYSLSKIDMQTYWEWPDNSVLKTVFKELKKVPLPKQKLSIGFPFYHHAAFEFYRKYFELDWLDIPSYRVSSQPIYDLMLINHSHMNTLPPKRYELVSSYPQFKLKLYRRYSLKAPNTN